MLSFGFGATQKEAEAPEGEASASGSGGGTSGRAPKRPSAAAASSSTTSSPDGKKSRSSAGNDTRELLVRSSEGDDVAWSRPAALRSAALANSLDNTDGDAPFPTPLPTAALRTLAQLAGVGEGDAEGGGAALAACPPASLAPLVHAAHFLDVDDRLRRLLSATFCRFLAGKSVEELTTALGATNDYPTAKARRAAVDEPIYEPDAPAAPGDIAPVAPPSVVRSVSSQLVNEDALEAALVEADVPTLRALCESQLASTFAALRDVEADVAAQRSELSARKDALLVELGEVSESLEALYVSHANLRATREGLADGVRDALGAAAEEVLRRVEPPG